MTDNSAIDLNDSVAPPTKKKPCRLRPFGTPKADLIADHRFKMERKRELRSRPQFSGFQPIPNKRLIKIASDERKRLEAACEGKSSWELLAESLPANDAEMQQAIRRRVSRDLPSPPMVRSTVITPTRNDHPDYRKPNLAKHLRV